MLNWNIYEALTPCAFFILLISLQINSVGVFSFLWLADAMEGPTPVSALLHSATLVISGCVIYFNIVVLSYLNIALILLIVSVVIIISTINVDCDIKNQAAISTCSILALVWIEASFTADSAWVLIVAHAGYNSIVFVLLAHLLVAHSVQDVSNISLCMLFALGNLSWVLILFCVGGLNYVYSNCNVGINVSVVGINSNTALISLTTTVFIFGSICLVWIFVFVDCHNNNLVLFCIRSYNIYCVLWCMFALILLSFGLVNSFYSTNFIYYYVQLICIGISLISMVFKSISYLQVVMCAIYFTSSLNYLHLTNIIFNIITKLMHSISLLRGQLLYVILMCGG